jgi:hypothetical protein
VSNSNGQILDANSQINIGGLGIIGLQINWDSNGLKDIRFGLDGGAGAATLYGGSINLQIGGMFVYNDFVIVPRIIQFAPDYYDAHINNNPPSPGFGGAGSTDPTHH